MAITLVGSASAASNTVTMPAHQVGDMIVTFVYNGASTTVPTATADSTGTWATTGTSCAGRVVYNIADTNSEVAGTWTNATAITVMIYRKAATDTWTAPVVYTSNGTGTTVTYAESSYYGPYFRPRWNNTESWMLRFAGHSAATDLASTTPSGWTARAGVSGIRSMDSGGVVSTKSSTSIGDNTQTVNTSGNWITMTVQVEIWNGTGIVCMSANTSNSDTASVYLLPLPGDLIVVQAGRGGSNTAPTMPSDYTLLTSGGANSLSNLVCYKIATGSDSAQFTNATTVSFTVYRTAGVFDAVDVGATTSGSSTTMSWTGSAVQPASNAVTKFIRFGVFYGTGFPAFPDGWPVRTVRTSVSPANWMSDADGFVNADSVGTNSITFGSALVWRATTIRIASRVAAGVENTNKSSAAVPTGIGGCYVTLIGGGGGGGGANKPSSGGYGAGGGGGGAAIKSAFIPVSALGSTYSLTRGLGGGGGSKSPTAGTAGGNSTFTSGSLTLTAGGGGGGAAGGSGTSAGGSSGTYSASGWGGWWYGAAENGGSGGSGSRAGSSGNGSAGASTTYAGPGGGGGGGNVSSVGSGYAGGSSATVAGGSGGAANGGTGGSPADAALGLSGGGGGGGAGNAIFGTAGSGGKGSVAGAGGGGSGGKEGLFGAGNSGGAGGDGYVYVEWVPPLATGQFFRTYEGF